jgi:HAD superfamily hydrolase (TIGR01509 family)
VVFDMDGVIADSEPAYFEAINEVLAPLGKYMDDALQRRIMGSRMVTTWVMLCEALSLPPPSDELIHTYDMAVRRILSQIHETLPGARELIAAIKQRGMPLGLASSSQPAWIESLLGGLGMTGVFDAIASGAEVTNGKPAPDVYLLAAERLGVPAVDCLAIEDTPTGLGASTAAGMFSVQVRSAGSAFPPQAIADVVLDSLREFDLGLLD